MHEVAPPPTSPPNPPPPPTPPQPPPPTSPPYLPPPTSPPYLQLASLDRRLASLDAGAAPAPPLNNMTPAVATDRLLCAPPCVCTAFCVYRLACGPLNNMTPAVATDRFLCVPPCVCTAFCVHRLACGPLNNKTPAVATDRLLCVCTSRAQENCTGPWGLGGAAAGGRAAVRRAPHACGHVPGRSLQKPLPVVREGALGAQGAPRCRAAPGGWAGVPACHGGGCGARRSTSPPGAAGRPRSAGAAVRHGGPSGGLHGNPVACGPHASLDAWS